MTPDREQPVSPTRLSTDVVLPPAQLLAFSAPTGEALLETGGRLLKFLETEEQSSVRFLDEFCYSLAVSQPRHVHRAAFVFRTRDELVEQLAAFVRGENPPTSAVGETPARPRKPVFVFSGQGTGNFGLSQELLAQETVFRAALEQCDELLQKHVSWSVINELTANEATSLIQLERTDVSQTALFALQVALAALWRSWGVEPDAVVGHSVGEIAAAHCAGVLNLSEAVEVVSLRAQLMQELLETDGKRGAMASVKLSREKVEEEIFKYQAQLGVAVQNAPNSTVLSGDAVAMNELIESLEGKGVHVRLLPLPGAGHSPQVDPLRDVLVQSLRNLRPKPSAIPIFSTVTARAEPGELFDAVYWGRNVRETVLFSDTIGGLIKQEHNIFIELSPHPILKTSIFQSLKHYGATGLVLPSLNRRENERSVLMGTLGMLYTQGFEFEWNRLYKGSYPHKAVI